jgi:hypothetical protein
MQEIPNKFNTICEDITMATSNHQHGMGSNQLEPTKTSLLDILSSYKKAKKKSQDSPNVTPYPIQSDPMIQDLGDLYVKAHEIGSKLRQANNNPLIEDNEEFTETLKTAFKKVLYIEKAIKSIANDLGNL